MKITLKNSLLFLAGLFVVVLIVDKLFGTIPASYSVWIFGVGCLLGYEWGFGAGRSYGEQKVRADIEQQLDQKHKYKQHTKLMKRYVKIENSPPIKVLGVELNRDDFPKLYQWAIDNPATLEQQLQSVADTFHEGNLDMAAIALESDMRHN